MSGSEHCARTGPFSAIRSAWVLAQKPLGRATQGALLNGARDRKGMFPCFKRVAVYLFSCVLYYTGLLRAVNALINRVQTDSRRVNAERLPVSWKRPRRNFQILVYHRVSEQKDIYFPPISVKVFEGQMRHLSRYFNVLRLEDAVSMMIKGELVENAMVVTFDDGYRDNFVNAFPILEFFGLPATIFLTAGVIGGGALLWHDRVFAAFRGASVSSLRDPAGSGRIYALGSPEEHLATLHEILRWLRAIPEARREEAIFALTNSLGARSNEEEKDIMLRWEDIRYMSQRGVNFGAHTMTHPILSTLDEGRVMAEIFDSKAVIEEQVGMPVRTFAYPNGKRDDYNKTTIDFLKKSGFLCAVTTVFGTNSLGDDLFQLKRESPFESNLSLFAFKRNWYKLTTST